tara:strand:+ start:1301 stop:3142 length:1842 start_codon:yes stop_codon:yes gene_type:complete
MPKKDSPHVQRLHRYLPFSPSHDQIYEEYQRADDALNLPTKALVYLIAAANSNARLIILTGDAGHGKTHLCRRLLEEYLGTSEEKARELINSQCGGGSIIESDRGKLPLRIYKDFSEISVNAAADKLEEAASSIGEVTVICANEGRLRAVLEHGSAHSANIRELRDQFVESFTSGAASRDGAVHIVNLNFQSIATEAEPSLVSKALKSWVSGARWKICADCDSRHECPILFNRDQFASGTENEKNTRIRRVELLFSTAERLGSVVTIREILMTIAYLLTGSLKCQDVHKKLSSRKHGWQHTYTFYSLLFEPPKEVNLDKLKKIPVLSEFSELDPGKRSIRKIDEKLINKQGVFAPDGLDLLRYSHTGKKTKLIDGANGIDEVIGIPRDRKERQAESKFVHEMVRSLRRKYFFEGHESNALRSLGFEHGFGFLKILSEDVSAAEMVEMKNSVISGLHTIQGIQMSSKETHLHIVDPSFSHSGAQSAIIARKVPSKSIKLVSMKRAWATAGQPNEYEISESVDWLDRYIVLSIEDKQEVVTHLNIDLMLYDCIARAGSGYVAEEFYAHDLRRVRTFLGGLARLHESDDDEISLFSHGKIYSLSIDDGVIQVGAGH